MRGPRGPKSGCPWRAAAVFVGTLLLGVAPRAAAADVAVATTQQSPALALAWTGPGPELTCLGEEGLARAVNDYLGRDAFAAGPVEYVLGVMVERLPDRHFRAVLELRDASGRVLGARVLRSAGELCSDLDEPLVLAVALMVDSEPEPEPPPPAAPPEPEPGLLEDDEPRAPRASSAPLEVFVDASLAIEAGLLPAVRPGLMLGAELRPASWLSARLSWVGFLPASADVPGTGSAHFAFMAGVLELCPGFGEQSSFRLSVCGGALYGALGARSAGLEGARSTWRPLLAAAFGPRASLSLGGRWFAVAGLTGIVPYRPERFVYEADGESHELFQCSSFSILASAGASVMF